jgi:hypothetical protein
MVLGSDVKAAAHPDVNDESSGFSWGAKGTTPLYTERNAPGTIRRVDAAVVRSIDWGSAAGRRS